jgi:hypothetical protein
VSEAGIMSRTREAVWLAAILASFVALAVFLANYLVPWDDEFGYIIYGPFAWTGQSRLFQDEMTGQRLPLPYWVIGLSQIITGTSVLTARLTSIVLGAMTIGLTFALGRVLAGPTGGFLSALFLATHALVVGYYAGASYHALSSLLLVAGLLAISRERSPVWPVLGMALIAGLWLCRANLAVMVPVVLGYLLVRARSRGEQLALLLAGLLPLAVFLAWSQEHLKILAYVPLASRLVAPLGYLSLFSLQDFPEGKPFAESMWWLVRRHLPWVTATVILLASALATRLGRPRVRWPSPPPLVVFMAGRVRPRMSDGNPQHVSEVSRSLDECVRAALGSGTGLWRLRASSTGASPAAGPERPGHGPIRALRGLRSYPGTPRVAGGTVRGGGRVPHDGARLPSRDRPDRSRASWRGGTRAPLRAGSGGRRRALDASLSCLPAEDAGSGRRPGIGNVWAPPAARLTGARPPPSGGT